jgi:hypothetical protein
MKINLLPFLDKKMTWIFTMIFMSFFIYIIINLLIHYACYIFITGSISQYPSIYGRYYICSKGHISRTIWGIFIFLFFKAGFFLLCSILKSYTSSFWVHIQKLSCIVIMTDMVYVILFLCFSRTIDWNFYFNSSFLIRGHVALFAPNWVFFGLSTILNIAIFKKLTNNSISYFIWCLFMGFLSFFFQLFITYLVFGKLFYVV